LGYHAKIINSGRYVNDSMGFYVGKQTVKKMIGHGKNPMESKVLIMGATFKEDVSDIRNSKIEDVIKELQSFACTVDVIDPHADSDQLEAEYGFGLKVDPTNDYDAVIVAVNHEEYCNFTEEDFSKMLKGDQGIIVDLKGIYKDKIKNIDYWSL
jgi:UDP-N-acetyl-D-galactosamine dehydrogenase